VLPGCQWHTRNEGEEPLSWFPVPYMVSRHTWNMRSDQRVSTFASGSSSVQRDAKPGGSRFRFASAWPARNNSARTPLTYKEASKAEKVKKNFRIQEVAFTVLLTSKLTEWHASDIHFDLAGHIHEGPNGET
jgi:hypothetical protein